MNGGSWVVLCAMLLLCMTCLSASAPVQDDLPTVDERFADWARSHNEHLIKDLPGATPTPDDDSIAIMAGLPADNTGLFGADVTQAAAAPTPTATATPAPQFKIYEPGELYYEGDGMEISVEQVQSSGITYFVADIKLSDVSQFATAFAGEKFGASAYETVYDIATRHDPILAINGDFYRFHTEGVIIRNGELYRKRALESRRHLLIVDSEGDLSALTDRTGKQGIVAENLKDKGTLQTFEFGPLLVENGEAVELPTRFYVKSAAGYVEPRTAIGQLGPLHYIVIVVEGRRDGYSTGADIPTLQQLFIDHGAQFAFNLDGGGSTTLYFMGEVINMPSSGAQRRVSDIVMFGGSLEAK